MWSASASARILELLGREVRLHGSRRFWRARRRSARLDFTSWRTCGPGLRRPARIEGRLQSARQPLDRGRQRLEHLDRRRAPRLGADERRVAAVGRQTARRISADAGVGGRRHLEPDRARPTSRRMTSTVHVAADGAHQLRRQLSASSRFATDGAGEYGRRTARRISPQNCQRALEVELDRRAVGLERVLEPVRCDSRRSA